MKINDLMIGDWIEWIGKKCKVDTSMIITEFEDVEKESIYVKPIKITKEILEKNGFVNCQTI